MKRQDSEWLSGTLTAASASAAQRFGGVSPPCSGLSLPLTASAPPFQSFSSHCYANASPSFPKISRIKVLHIPRGPAKARTHGRRAGSVEVELPRRLGPLVWTSAAFLPAARPPLPGCRCVQEPGFSDSARPRNLISLLSICVLLPLLRSLQTSYLFH